MAKIRHKRKALGSDPLVENEDKTITKTVKSLPKNVDNIKNNRSADKKQGWIENYDRVIERGED